MNEEGRRKGKEVQGQGRDQGQGKVNVRSDQDKARQGATEGERNRE
jgi:hypothetical protein